VYFFPYCFSLFYSSLFYVWPFHIVTCVLWFLFCHMSRTSSLGTFLHSILLSGLFGFILFPSLRIFLAVGAECVLSLCRTVAVPWCFLLFLSFVMFDLLMSTLLTVLPSLVLNVCWHSLSCISCSWCFLFHVFGYDVVLCVLFCPFVNWLVNYLCVIVWVALLPFFIDVLLNIACLCVAWVVFPSFFLVVLCVALLLLLLCQRCCCVWRIYRKLVLSVPLFFCWLWTWIRKSKPVSKLD